MIFIDGIESARVLVSLEIDIVTQNLIHTQRY